MPEFTLSKIGITGFRGFTSLAEIEFGSPLTLIYGLNRNGKSSIINAIEWCLFGPEVAAIKYGDIRERDGWEVKNLKAPSCHVRCEFVAQDGRILRVDRAFKTTRTSELSFGFEGCAKSADDKQLLALLKISPTDFVTSVHLHPEIIRSLIVAKPRDRKEAIDRLLGLSELRDMVECFASEKPSGWTEVLEQNLTVLNEKLTTALGEKKRVIDNESTELTAKGIKPSELTEKGALNYSTALLSSIQKFSTQYQLITPAIPAPHDSVSLHQFCAQLPKSIENLRNEHPILADQGKLLIKKSELGGLKANHLSQQQKVADAEHALASYPDQRNDEELASSVTTVKADIEKVDSEMKVIAKNAKMLDEALHFFERQSESERLSCPICGETSRTVAEWRSHLKEEISAKNLQPLRARKDELTLSLGTLEGVIVEKSTLRKRIMDENARLMQSTRSIEKSLNRTIQSTDDVSAILSNEIESLQKSLNSFQQQIQEINASFTSFQDALNDLERFQRIAKAQMEIARIEAVSDSSAYKLLKGYQAEAEQYAEDIEFLVEGLKSTVQKEAQQRLKDVQDSVSTTFTKLTNRPDFPGLKVSTSPEGYVIELTNPKATTKAIPILNHGDINCAALSIFLALAGSAQISHSLGFLILDDPSQSLDISCKKALCDLLASLCNSRQVILATADAELHAEANKITKKKLSYTVRSWTPDKGPVVEAESTQASHAV
jgi:DNA repair exonuclease SbcCD ATPase subunit